MTEQHIAGTIGILGAGWLGLPLARALLAAGKPVAVISYVGLKIVGWC